MEDEIKDILARLSRYVITPDVRHDFDDLLDYITNLQEENERLRKDYGRLMQDNAYTLELEQRNEEAIEYITSYESISTIQGLDKIEQNKTLDEKTIIVMVNRYLEVHDKLLNILQGGDEE